MTTTHNCTIKEGVVYDDAIFLDNDLTQIEYVHNACPNITILHVGGNENLHATPYKNNPLKSYIESHELGPADNLYSYICRIGMNMKSELYDPTSGIQESFSHLRVILQWLVGSKKQDSKQRAALIDWDRTITMIEGVHLGNDMNGSLRDMVPPLQPNSDVYNRDIVEDTLVYICGGKKRLQFLRDLFEAFYENKVDIILLSNNTACDTPVFRELLAALVGPGRPPIGVIAGKYHNNDKGEALKAHHAFHTLCKS